MALETRLELSSIGCVWFLLSLIVGATSLLASIPAPFPQAVPSFLVILLLVSFWIIKVFRDWPLNVDIRTLLLIHISRFLGVCFLILYSKGEHPHDCAVLGGWGDIGDIIVAIAALLVLIFSPRRGLIGFVIYFILNLFGFIDIFFVVMTAGRLAMAYPQSMMALAKFPLGLLRAFLVPIIIYSHIVIFIRIWRAKITDTGLFNPMFMRIKPLFRGI